MKPDVITKKPNLTLLALALWVCTAPLVFLVTVQITGAARGGMAVAALLAAYLAVCYVTHRVLTRRAGRGASDANQTR